MNIPYPAIALSCATAFAAAADTEAPFEALFIAKDGTSRPIQLLSATKDTFVYQEMRNQGGPVVARIPADGNAYLLEPPELSEAMDLYQSRKYQEARAAFVRVKDAFKPVALLENSPAALAAFYEMECLRKTGDPDGLSAAIQCFTGFTLTHEYFLSQIELYVLWEAARTKSWERLETLAVERAAARLPGDQRAQVAMCHGLALEGLNRPEEAIAAYQTALTADSGASEEIARAAALRILAIHHADPRVKQAALGKGRTDEDKDGNLLEAAAVASLFQMSLGAGTPLPDEFKEFPGIQAPAPSISK